MILKRRQLNEAGEKFLRAFAIVSAVVIAISYLIGLGIGVLIKRYFNL